MTKDLNKAIRQFRRTPLGRRTADPKQAEDQCSIASWAFVKRLRKAGIEAFMVEMHGVAGEDLPVVPGAGPGEVVGHCVVLTEGRVIDWTARQFNPAANHPAFITPWRRCRTLTDDDVAAGGARIRSGVMVDLDGEAL